MSNHLEEFEKHRRRGMRAVIYLEGVTDPAMAVGLGGLASVGPDGSELLVGDALFVGMTEGGSGRKAVENRVKVVLEEDRRFPVFGITDGDGESFQSLSTHNEAPERNSDHLFRWPAYCLENLLAQSCWPASWGTQPDWPSELVAYSPYVAWNAMVRWLSTRLSKLGVDNYSGPPGHTKRLDTSNALLHRLKTAQAFNPRLQIKARFDASERKYWTALTTSLDAAHCMLNGKWLVSDFVRRHVPDCRSKTESDIRAEWLAAARAAGGNETVKDIWDRICVLAPK